MNAKKEVPRGLKRHLASVLAAVLEVLRVVPGAEQIVLWLEKAAGALGLVGLGHAAAKGTVSRFKLAGLSSLVSTIILLAYFVPSLQSLVPVLQKVAALLGAAAVGGKLANS